MNHNLLLIIKKNKTDIFPSYFTWLVLSRLSLNLSALPYPHPSLPFSSLRYLCTSVPLLLSTPIPFLLSTPTPVSSLCLLPTVYLEGRRLFLCRSSGSARPRGPWNPRPPTLAGVKQEARRAFGEHATSTATWQEPARCPKERERGGRWRGGGDEVPVVVVKGASVERNAT